MATYTQFSNRSFNRAKSNRAKSAQPSLLPTRYQLESFLQSKGIPAKKLGQMSTWEQIQLTHEYQQLMESSSS